MRRHVSFDRWSHRIASAALFAAIGWFYIWTVSQGLPLPFGTKEGFYPRLTDAFLAGQLSLLVVPHPDLLAMEDPYTNVAHRSPFLHDASLYKGKYYAYFGATPVVLLFLPFRVLQKGNLPESAAAAVFLFGGLIFSLLTLSYIRRTTFPTLRRVSYDTYLMLALGGAIPYFLRRPAVYEVAIACGSFCIAAAIYFLVSLESEGKISLWRASLASLFIGLAVGARPHLLMASALVGFVVWRLLRRDGRWPSVTVMCSLLAPMMAVGAVLAIYNYARFDSFTEFGRWYQLAGEDVREMKFDILRIPVLSYLYLWHPGHVNLAFPYTHVTNLPFTIRGGVTVEPAAGVFYTTPILYVLAFLPILRPSRNAQPQQLDRPNLTSAHQWAWTLVVLALAQVLFLGTFPGATMRYIVDFSPLLMTAAGIVLMSISTRLASSRWKVAAKTAIVLLVGLTIFLNVSLGVRGYYDNLKGDNPDAYNSLKRASDSVIDAVVPWVFNKDLQLLTIASPGGVEQRVGAPSFWVAHDESDFEVFSKREGYIILRTDFSIHADFKAFANVRLVVRSGVDGSVQSLTVGNQEITLVLRVRRGHNRFYFRAADVPPSPRPNEPRVLLLTGKDWTFSATAPVR